MVYLLGGALMGSFSTNKGCKLNPDANRAARLVPPCW